MVSIPQSGLPPFRRYHFECCVNALYMFQSLSRAYHHSDVAIICHNWRFSLFQSLSRAYHHSDSTFNFGRRLNALFQSLSRAYHHSDDNLDFLADYFASRFNPSVGLTTIQTHLWVMRDTGIIVFQSLSRAYHHSDLFITGSSFTRRLVSSPTERGATKSIVEVLYWWI